MTDVMPFAILAAMLDTWVTETADTPHVGLFANNIEPDEDTVLADLVEPTDDWYARLPATYGETYRGLDGRPHRTVGSLQFNWTAAGGAGPITIYGFFVASALAAGSVLHIKRLATPITLSNTFSSLVVQPDLKLNATAP